jgi:hypothetical protein
MLYFGTSLDRAGHYIWELTGGMYRSEMRHADIPFDFYKHRQQPWGHVQFEHHDGLSVLFISGSCADSRSGTVSVFFVNGTYSKAAFIELMKQNPTAMQIINAMPFPVEGLKEAEKVE